MFVRTLHSVADFNRAIETSSYCVVQFTSCRGPLCKTSPSPSLATYALRYSALHFYAVDALAHPAILAEADVARLPADGSPLFLFYEAGQGCVDAVVGADGANLGRTLKLFNPGPGSEPSSPVSPLSPEAAWLVPESPVVTFSSKWGLVEDDDAWGGRRGYVGFA